MRKNNIIELSSRETGIDPLSELLQETFARKPFHLHATLKTYSIGHL